MHKKYARHPTATYRKKLVARESRREFVYKRAGEPQRDFFRRRGARKAGECPASPRGTEHSGLCDEWSAAPTQHKLPTQYKNFVACIYCQTLHNINYWCMCGFFTAKKQTLRRSEGERCRVCLCNVPCGTFVVTGCPRGATDIKEERRKMLYMQAAGNNAL